MIIYRNQLKNFKDMSATTEQQAGEPTPSPYPYSELPKWPTKIGTQPAGADLHACLGLNACKGQDRFGLEGPNADGKTNDCAGQGYCSTTADHTCHVLNDCKDQGGCGLYGTADEMNRPASNDCANLGSCATPINAERFSTNGPNQGKSVWTRARQVFEEKWGAKRNDIAAKIEAGSGLPLPPEQLGQAPLPFGPPYLWITDDNENRGNMTACGASGLSGAGGCGG